MTSPDALHRAIIETLVGEHPTYVERYFNDAEWHYNVQQTATVLSTMIQSYAVTLRAFCSRR